MSTTASPRRPWATASGPNYVYDAQTADLLSAYSAQPNPFVAVRYSQQAYDAHFNRVTKATSSSSFVYIGKLYERVTSGTTVTQRHLLYAGSSLVGVYNVNNGIGATYYFLTDHLGSVDTLTDASGAVTARYSYDAHGKRRYADGTDAPITTYLTGARRGFTQHEHDDEVGLINMNAREYDYVIGRFISPDTIVPGALNSQAFNRYSYALNNPLSRIDPTGQWSLRKAVRSIARALVGGSVVSASVPVNLAPRKETVANFTGNVLNKVSQIPYIGGLMSTGMLIGPMGVAYGWSTGDWRTVVRAHETGAVIAATAWAAPQLTALQWYGYPTYIGANMALGYTSGYAIAEINGATGTQARTAGIRGAQFAGVMSLAYLGYENFIAQPPGVNNKARIDLEYRINFEGKEYQWTGSLSGKQIPLSGSDLNAAYYDPNIGLELTQVNGETYIVIGDHGIPTSSLSVYSNSSVYTAPSPPAGNISLRVDMNYNGQSISGATGPLNVQKLVNDYLGF